jgi:hypothetical protein
MLKKSLFSPTQPRRAKTRLFPCGVLASFRPSTLSRTFGYRKHWRGFPVRQDSFSGRTAHTKCGMYLLRSSLAAALLDDLFEHPAGLPVLLQSLSSPASPPACDNTPLSGVVLQRSFDHEVCSVSHHFHERSARKSRTP